jgi:hypothetical protein
MPHGLGPEGNRLWTGVIGEFNLAYEPHKVRILTDVCKTADLIKRLDDAAGQSAADCQGVDGPALNDAISGAKALHSPDN